MLEKLKRKFVNCRQSLDLWSHRRRLAKAVDYSSDEYRAYLDLQLERTLAKRRPTPPDRDLELMARVAGLITISERDVLCVGCRDAAEIEYFSSKGARRVCGIDLYSECKDIVVMDMHDMKFDNSSFDLLYSSHSLEHALNVRKAISEFVRVVRNGGSIVVEVPVNYEVRGADLVDFGSLENLHDHFKPYLEKVLWSETITGPIDAGSPVVALRTIMTIRK